MNISLFENTHYMKDRINSERSEEHTDKYISTKLGTAFFPGMDLVALHDQ